MKENILSFDNITSEKEIQFWLTATVSNKLKNLEWFNTNVSQKGRLTTSQPPVIQAIIYPTQRVEITTASAASHSI